MWCASIYFSGKSLWIPVAVLFCIIAALVFRSYRDESTARGIRLTCSLLKLAGITLILASLLEPVWRHQSAVPGANWYAVVADNSSGMQVRNDAGVSRADRLREMLAEGRENWMDDLESTFQVRRYLVDERLKSVPDFNDIPFTGNGSRLVTGLNQIRERYQDQPLAGVLLFTDGNATDIPVEGMQLDGLPPVFPVTVDDSFSARDIALRKVAASQSAFEDAPVTIQAEVAANGFTGRSITAWLEELETGAIAATGTNPSESISVAGNVASETQTARKELERLVFRFKFEPAVKGLHFYRLRVHAGSNPLPPGTPMENDTSEEATLLNNQRLVMVDRGDGPYRILYVSGRPNWEYKFLNRALEADDELRMTALIRVARREPKFEFRGRSGESSNPLYRGFTQQDETTEQYDQPVLIVLNRRTPDELQGGFPRAAEDLFEYHGIILDDVEAEFFKPDHMSLMERFVSDRGGGLMMLGGAESFANGGYDRTPVGNMLPVYLDEGLAQMQNLGARAGWNLDLTREGMLESWARIESTEAEESRRLDNLPPFQVLNPVSSVKPGASVILQAIDERGREWPGLVIQKFGAGRTAAMTIGDFWRSGRRTPEQAQEHERAWRQIVRWLVTDSPPRFELAARPSTEGDPGAMQLTVTALTEEYLPVENALVEIHIEPVLKTDGLSTNKIVLDAEPAESMPGRFQTLFVSREPNGYLAEAIIRDENRVELGRVQSGWVTNPEAAEFESLEINRAFLEEVASQTGGQVIAENQLNRWASEQPDRDVPVTESVADPLWHNPWVFLLAIGCLIGEWGIRRWKGLA